ncbi:hypothetical protein K3495_g9681 [Podosphaera aphanis]|nr:hypothetical protein K3495_g9681 [Podosphaera aphanis]
MSRLEIKPEEISVEADTQTGVKPIDCSPVRKFRLFVSSDESKIIDPKPPINRHDPSCQGYRSSAKCTRQSRRSHCGARIDTHEGPSGQNCTHSTQSGNCFGPFPSGHDYYPAAPKRKNGKLIKATKKELSAIRRHGTRDFKNMHEGTPMTPTPSAAQSTTEEHAVSAQPKMKRVPTGRVAVTAHENLSSTHTASPSPPALPAISGSAPLLDSPDIRNTSTPYQRSSSSDRDKIHRQFGPNLLLSGDAPSDNNSFNIPTQDSGDDDAMAIDDSPDAT